jgi:hypothetical protein
MMKDMEPEEIDKLFRDKLAGMPVLPPADAWNRLQEKMEPPKKEKTRWLYYAAASVLLLLMAGILFLKTGDDPAGPAVATAPLPVPQAGQPRVEKSAAPETPAIADKTAKPDQTIHRQPEAPAAQVAASMPVARQAKANNLRVAAAPRRKPGPASHRAAITSPDPQPVLTARQPEQTLAVAPAVHSPSRPAGAAVQPTSLASVRAMPGVVEVVVTRGPDPAADEDLSLRDNLSRKGNLLKNIYKQARNLKNGEPVELAALGVDKEKIKEETKELKQKISNVISL